MRLVRPAPAMKFGWQMELMYSVPGSRLTRKSASTADFREIVVPGAAKPKEAKEIGKRILPLLTGIVTHTYHVSIYGISAPP